MEQSWNLLSVLGRDTETQSVHLVCMATGKITFCISFCISKRIELYPGASVSSGHCKSYVKNLEISNLKGLYSWTDSTLKKSGNW